MESFGLQDCHTVSFSETCDIITFISFQCHHFLEENIITEFVE
jgi:hypothetical protein